MGIRSTESHSSNNELGAIGSRDGNLGTPIIVPELRLEVGVLDKVGSAADPFCCCLSGDDVEDAPVPVIEEGKNYAGTPGRVPLENVAGEFTGCVLRG